MAGLASLVSARGLVRGCEATFPGDWRAAWVSAIVMLPQTIVLATLAGMPPETGVYASVFPVIVAALVGASPRLLSGPNTAVAAMMATALAPLATAASDEYVALALMLTAMVGAVQILGAVARLGRLFDAMPDCIVHGVTLGIGLVIVVTQLPTVLGVLTVPGEAPWLSLWHTLAALPRLNPFSVAVGIITVCAAMASKRVRALRGKLLVVAFVIGTITAVGFDFLLGVDVVNLDRVGNLTLSLLPLSMPRPSWDQYYVLKQLAQSALAIAVIGALQTVIIARSIASPDQARPNPNRELLAQGLANTVASFTSGFAGSGSFNRSAAHVAAGARSPLAAVLSAPILFFLVFAVGPLLAKVPTAAMAGTLMLVGWGLVRSTPMRQLRKGGRYALPATLVVALLVVAAGLETAVFWACTGGLAVLVWRHATPHHRQSRPPAKPA